VSWLLVVKKQAEFTPIEEHASDDVCITILPSAAFSWRYPGDDLLGEIYWVCFQPFCTPSDGSSLLENNPIYPPSKSSSQISPREAAEGKVYTSSLACSSIGVILTCFFTTNQPTHPTPHLPLFMVPIPGSLDLISRNHTATSVRRGKDIPFDDHTNTIGKSRSGASSRPTPLRTANKYLRFSDAIISQNDILAELRKGGGGSEMEKTLVDNDSS